MTTKLSALIRQGSTQIGQGHFAFFRANRHKGVCLACPLGMAYVALFGIPKEVPSAVAILKRLERAGLNLDVCVQSPVETTYDHLGYVIVQLNDIHKWSPNEIANYLEQKGF